MPDQAAPSPASPYAFAWPLRKKGTSEERTFEQIELSIEGEARLIAIARDIAILLQAKDYTWERLQTVMNSVADRSEMAPLLNLVADLSGSAPGIVADFLTVILGIYPTDLEGRPNVSYDADRRWLIQSVNLVTLYEMVRVFLAQNDYMRLWRTFTGTLAGTTDALGAVNTAEASLEPLPDGQIVSADGSVIPIEPDQTNLGMSAPPTSATETPSDSF